MEEVHTLESDLREESLHPRDLKMRLAKEIVSLYHGKEKAKDAENAFTKTFQKGEIPDDIAKVSVKKGTLLVDVLMEQELVKSKSDFRRLAEAGAITYVENGHTVSDDKFLAEEGVLKIGKRRFLKITSK